MTCKSDRQLDEIITHRVRVDRNRSPQQALDATGFRQHFVGEDKTVVETMPRGEGVQEEDVYFFKPEGFIDDSDQLREYQLRRLEPADPYLLMAVNEHYPDFVRSHPNTVHWQHGGYWYFMTFNIDTVVVGGEIFDGLAVEVGGTRALRRKRFELQAIRPASKMARGYLFICLHWSVVQS